MPDSRPALTTQQHVALLSTFLYQLISSAKLNEISPAQLLEVVEQYRPPLDNIDSAGQIVEEAQAHQQVFGSAGEHFASYAKEAGWDLPAATSALRFWHAGSKFARLAGVQTGEYALLVNGRVVNPIEPTSVEAHDIETLVTFERRRRVDEVVSGLEEIVKEEIPRYDKQRYAHLVTMASSIIGKAYEQDETAEGMFHGPPNQRTTAFDRLGAELSMFEIGKRDEALFRFTVILDPLSESAQRWSSVLELISRLDGVYIKVVLNPLPNLSELPLKRFYRFSARSELAFDQEG